MRPLNRAVAVLAAASALLAVAAQAQQAPPAPPSPQQKAGIRLICPKLIAHKDSEMKAIPFRVNGMTVYACSDVSIQIFKKNPERFVHGVLNDPVSGEEFQVTANTPKFERGKDVFLFATTENRAVFLKAPAKYLKPPPR